MDDHFVSENIFEEHLTRSCSDTLHGLGKFLRLFAPQGKRCTDGVAWLDRRSITGLLTMIESDTYGACVALLMPT